MWARTAGVAAGAAHARPRAQVIDVLSALNNSRISVTVGQNNVSTIIKSNANLCEARAARDGAWSPRPRR